MKKEIIDKEALDRLGRIHQLSKKLNETREHVHAEKLLALMRHHVEEIEQLRREGNEHFLIETGDLMVLCMEMLMEHKASVDETLLRCFERYEKKLASLLHQKDSSRRSNSSAKGIS